MKGRNVMYTLLCVLFLLVLAMNQIGTDTGGYE